MLSLMSTSDSMNATIEGKHYFDFPIKDENCQNDDDNCGMEDENLVVEKVEKGRERNREHAKRTRLRKKAVLEGMKGKLMELQNEVRGQLRRRLHFKLYCII